MNQITDEDLRKIAADVEREYGTCGLSGGTLYEDFAVAVANRAIAMERERWRDKAEALEHSLDDHERNLRIADKLIDSGDIGLPNFLKKQAE